MHRFCLTLVHPDDDNDSRVAYVESCCTQSALTATWDEDGERLDGDYSKAVEWSEDAESGEPDTAPAVCEDCL